MSSYQAAQVHNLSKIIFHKNSHKFVRSMSLNVCKAYICSVYPNYKRGISISKKLQAKFCTVPCHHGLSPKDVAVYRVQNKYISRLYFHSPSQYAGKPSHGPYNRPHATSISNVPLTEAS